MLNLKIYFTDHPLVGMLSVFLASLLPFIQWLTPFLQFAGLVTGVLIGILTLAAKIEELYLRIRNPKKGSGK